MEMSSRDKYRGHRLCILTIAEVGTHIEAIETQVWKQVNHIRVKGHLSMSNKYFSV